MANPLTEPEEFNRWLANPLTEAFRAYLRDYRNQLAMEWAKGSPLTPLDQCRAEMATDLSELRCADVRAFYGLEDKTDE
jgi:hypothetical protein